MHTIKVSLNVSKLVESRGRKGNRNPQNNYHTLLITQMQKPDEDGNTHTVQYAQTTNEVKNKSKKIHVGKAKPMYATSAIADEDKDKFFMVYAEGQNGPVKKHDSFKSAMHEVYRLAAMGLDAYALEVVGAVAGNKKEPSEMPKANTLIENEKDSAPTSHAHGMYDLDGKDLSPLSDTLIVSEAPAKKKERKRIPISAKPQKIQIKNDSSI